MTDDDIVSITGPCGVPQLAYANNGLTHEASPPLSAGYYAGYFQVVADISNEMGLGFMTLSPENQRTLERLIYEYGILQDRRNIKNVGENKGRRASDRQKVVPIKLKVDNS